MDSLLIVEDSKSFAALLQNRIRSSLNVKVVWARTFAEADAIMKSGGSPFFLGILDLNLPDAPRGEIVDLVLRQGIPSIVLTGVFREELQDRFLAKGILDYFVKDNIGVVDSVIHFVNRIRKNQNIKVLVVDDSSSARAILCGFLQRYGFTVLQTADGSHALQILEQQEVSLVISDYQMPGMDGIQLTKKVRAIRGRDEVALIGLSSMGDSDLAVRFIKAGANDFLVKPFKNEELLCRVFQNIENIERYQALDRLVERHRSVLDNALDAIITTDGQGQVLDYNPAAEILFGFPKEAILGKRVSDCIVPQDLRDKHQAALVRWSDANQEQPDVLRRRMELPGLRADGKIIDLQVALTAIRHEDGRHFTAFLQDITDRKQLLKSLEETLATAESANKAKSEFIANMSHEIRTPMNAVIGFTDLALKSDLTPRLRDYLEKVEHSSHSLMGIINDILDFSKIEAGRLNLDPTPFDLHELFDRLSNLFSKQTADKAIELVLMIPQAFEQTLIGDEQRLEQVLINLVRNAIKFTPEGSIVVRAKPGETANGTIQLLFSVQDTGIGIDPESLPQLFAPFVQADGSTTRKYGGTGLGLTICKRLVEMMGGRIWAESVPGQGSVFQFELAFQYAAADRTHALIVPEEHLGMRVLAVDDNAFTRDLLKGMLETLGLEPALAKSGDEGLSLLMGQAETEKPFELVVMDWRMPEKDGITTIQALQSRFAAQVPDLIPPRIIMLTAFGEEDVREQAMKSGVDAFLSKPVTRPQLFNAIMEVLGIAHTMKKAPQGKVLAKETETAEKISGARILLVEDNGINQQVARELLERVGLWVETANNGREAVEMLEKGDFNAVLMDVQMPVMDGYAATRHLRADPRFKTLPIIAMTAHALDEERKNCMAAGMNAHLAKPIRPERLYGTLAQWVGPVVDPGLTNNAGDEEIVFPHVPGLDMESGLERVGGNRKLYRKLLARFRDEQAETLIAIQATLAAGDLKEAGNLAHAVKGVAGNVGAELLHDAAKKMEDAIKKGDIQTWGQATENFVRVLNPMLKSLQGLGDDPPPSSPASVSQTPVVLEELAPLLRELFGHLENNSIEIDALLNQVGEKLAASKVVGLMRKLNAAIDHYEFEQAMEHLKKIAKALDILL